MKFLADIKKIPLLFLFLSATVFAQEIQIRDLATGRKISNVDVYNQDKSKVGISNAKGRINISMFSDDEKIFFHHISYIEINLTKQEIINNDGKVYLSKKSEKLSEIVISVSKWKQNKKEIPKKIVSLTADEIAFTTPQTSADLLERSGQVFVQKSQLGGGSPMIRGFSTNRLLLSVDGIRMNNAIFRGGNIQNVIAIDPFAVQNTEVILGSGSVIYGSDAIGGVMNFYTLTPKPSWKDETTFSGNASSRFSSANTEKTGHVDFNIGMKKWAFQTSISYTDFSDLRMGRHGPNEYLRSEYVTTQNGIDAIVQNDNPRLQKFTGYNQINLLEKIRLVPDDYWDFELGLHYSSTSDYPRYDRLTQYRDDELRYADWHYGPQRWFMGNLQINKKGNGKLFDNAKFTNAFQYFEESRHNRLLNSTLLNSTEERVYALSSNLDFEKRLNKRAKLFYGLEYVYNKVHSDGSEKDIITESKADAPSRYPDGAKWQSMAFYSALEYKLNPKLTLQSGLRYNHITIDTFFDTTFFPFPFTEANVNTGAFTGSLGLSWLPKNWQVTANLSTAFRAPNIDDIGKVFDSEPGAVVVPNPGLQPEYAYSAEIGILRNFNDIFSFNFGAYYTLLDDALIREDFQLNGASEIIYNGELSTVQAIQNASKAYAYGLELGVKLNMTKKLSLNSNITIPKGKEELADGSDEPLRHAPPIFGNTHLIYESGKTKLDFYANYNGKLSFDDLAISERNKPNLYALDANGNPFSPSWYTLNLASKFNITDAIHFTGALENITDQRYRTYSSGISAPGRNLVLSVNYTF